MASSKAYSENTFSVPRTCSVRRLLNDVSIRAAEEDAADGACLLDSNDRAN